MRWNQKWCRLCMLIMMMTFLSSGLVYGKTIRPGNTKAVTKSVDQLLNDCKECLGYTISMGLESGCTKEYIFSKSSHRQYFARFCYVSDRSKKNSLNLFGKTVTNKAVNPKAYQELGLNRVFYTDLKVTTKNKKNYSIYAKVNYQDLESGDCFRIGSVKLKTVLKDRSRYGLVINKAVLRRYKSKTLL